MADDDLVCDVAPTRDDVAVPAPSCGFGEAYWFAGYLRTFFGQYDTFRGRLPPLRPALDMPGVPFVLGFSKSKKYEISQIFEYFSE